VLAITAGVVIEKFFYGFGAVGYMIYLMQQLAPGKYTTTHYAFGTGLMGLCNMVTGMVSGHLQEMMGYAAYFGFVMVATLPAFVATWFAPFHHDEKSPQPQTVVPAQAGTHVRGGPQKLGFPPARE
jgi:PAT family beta-lactamase induction signal transducer AmpG